jgi:hypothetical protein
MTDLIGLERTMNMSRRWGVLAAVILILGGCATDGSVKPVGLGQKIEAARTRADHQEIAVVYERQAESDRAAAERHRGLARAYEQGWVWNPPRVGGVSSARRENQNLIAHCENLVRIYQQAAEENIALARAHRQLAVELKD